VSRTQATAAGVAYVPGRPFHVNGDGAHELRLSFSALDEAALDEAAQRLAGVISAALEPARTG
jgi:DNA-binding transcriptional MocR family regulator